MNIVVIQKNVLNVVPPLISVIQILCKLGHQVTVISTGVSDLLRRSLEECGVDFFIIKENRSKLVSKIYSFWKFRQEVFAILKKIESPVLWIEGAQTIFSLGVGIKKFRYYLHILELYEKVPYWIWAISRVIHDAEGIFIPEYSRACMYQGWFKLKNPPVVLPNKLFMYPSEEILQDFARNKYHVTLESLNGKRVILYQGGISKDRDLTTIVLGIKRYRDLHPQESLVFLLIGGGDLGLVNLYKKILPDMLYLGYLSFPEYFVFTQRADVGVLCYNPDSINNIFCAPNKVFEYSLYSIPMLANRLPGLRSSIIDYCAGEFYDLGDEESVCHSLEALFTNWEKYSKNARMFFENCRPVEIIQKNLLIKH